MERALAVGASFPRTVMMSSSEQEPSTDTQRRTGRARFDVRMGGSDSGDNVEIPFVASRTQRKQNLHPPPREVPDRRCGRLQPTASGPESRGSPLEGTGRQPPPGRLRRTKPAGPRPATPDPPRRSAGPGNTEGRLQGQLGPQLGSAPLRLAQNLGRGNAPPLGEPVRKRQPWTDPSVSVELHGEPVR